MRDLTDQDFVTLDYFNNQMAISQANLAVKAKEDERDAAIAKEQAESKARQDDIIAQYQPDIDGLKTSIPAPITISPSSDIKVQ